EPFIDTLVICTLTGLVILSSGVWQEKFETVFSGSDTEIVAGLYSDKNPEHVRHLARHLDLVPPSDDPVIPFTGVLEAVNGELVLAQATVLHNRSVAEGVTVSRNLGPYSGPVEIRDGTLVDSAMVLSGESLLHSVPLTAKAFERSFLGAQGAYLVTIGLLLFAFSTAIAWSYYGDRAVTYLLGSAWVMPYRCLYVLGFFLATIVDTSLIWLISAVTVAMMTLPNLIGIVLMRREVRGMTSDYWTEVRSK
ncbi:MAG TPA: sodium:alanine symporter family protein, partial [Gammaproteobacteria bacterium]|nr:sodium:alanine symporter family protein [Gammaproteobacteria bacterium]